MSIASEIERINNNISSAYVSAYSLGAETAETENSENLSSTIESISAVLYTEQTLTDEQKEQARDNIGAVSSDKGVYYIEGTGTTAGTWLGSHDDITAYYDGLTILYKLNIAGTSGGTTLNINGLGAVSVVRNATTAVTTHYPVNSVLIVVYTVDASGTAYFKVADYDSNNKISQYNTTANNLYPLLFKYGAGNTSTSTTTAYARYSNKFYVNPSTGELVLPKLTAEEVTGYAKSEDIPTKLSDLTDDSGFVKSVNGERPDANGNVKVTAQAEQPNFVESVDEMTDTSKAYVLKSTGEIWTYQSYTTEPSITPNFTNLYNKNNVTVNKAYGTVNTPAEAIDGYYLTGLYSYDFSNYDLTNPSIVRIKGGVDTTYKLSRLVYFRQSDLATEKFRAYQQFNTASHITYQTEADGTISFPLVVKPNGSSVHGDYPWFVAFSFSFYKSDAEITIDDVPDLIITIDEPITYTEIPAQTVYEWRSTGMSYNATDYEPRIIALEEDVAELDTRVTALENSGGSAVSTRHKHQDNAVLTVTTLNNSATFSENGITFVGDELWVMKDDSTYTNGTRIFRYHVDGDTFTYLGYIDGDFGHLNTMDYCEANDCFIFGNGGNDTSTEGNFFVVIKNPLSLGYAETVTIAELVTAGKAIKYDLDSTIGSIGFKVQALWGDSNLGDNNIVVLIASNTQTIKHVLLTKTDGEFDGGLIVLRSFTDMEAFGVQDSDIWGDTLYIGGQGTVGDPGRYLICEVSLTDPTQRRIIARDFYQEDGTALTGCVQGVYVDHDYIWLATNAASNTGKAVALTKYRR